MHNVKYYIFLFYFTCYCCSWSLSFGVHNDKHSSSFPHKNSFPTVVFCLAVKLLKQFWIIQCHYRTLLLQLTSLCYTALVKGFNLSAMVEQSKSEQVHAGHIHTNPPRAHTHTHFDLNTISVCTSERTKGKKWDTSGHWILCCVNMGMTFTVPSKSLPLSFLNSLF